MSSHASGGTSSSARVTRLARDEPGAVAVTP